ncbi:hypothetical protein BX616_008978, partial [Lobosporangium transversale]
GNVELIAKKPGLAVYGADARIPEINYVVKDKEEFKIGNVTIQALWTHCHTKGSISYYAKDGTDRAVFTGDTLFLSGCGRFFEGTAADMYNSLLHILATLPVETKVYCGHEYTKANLQFAHHVEPDNPHVTQKLQWCMDDNVKITIPGTIGEELLCNPFLRVNEPSLQAFTGKSDPIDVMHVLRDPHSIVVMAPKFKKAKLKAALFKLQDTHQKRQHATEVHEKKEAAIAASAKKAQQGANGSTIQKAQQLKAQKKAMSKLPPPPYNDQDTILLVGEANFSFAKSLALEILNRGDTMTATTLDSFSTMTEKYTEAQENVKELEEAGATVLFEVDATKLDKIKSFKGKRFSKIIFNFPHALIRSFFESAAPFLTDTDQGDKKAGEIHVTLKSGQPYDMWNIKRLATGTGLLGVKTSFPFRPEQYSGYEHRRTIGYKEGVSQGGNAEIKNKNPKTFVFVKKMVKEADVAKEQESANIKKRKRAGEDLSDDDE